jgi:hypothetical protein
MWCHQVLVLAAMLMCHGADACKVLNWRRMSMGELLTSADIVVYGQDVRHVNRTDSSISGFTHHTDSQFLVLCLLKSDDRSVAENITIDRISPRTDCSGTDGDMVEGAKVM